MATITINGHTINMLDDGFLNLSPEEQRKEIENIAIEHNIPIEQDEPGTLSRIASPFVSAVAGVRSLIPFRNEISAGADTAVDWAGHQLGLSDAPDYDASLARFREIERQQQAQAPIAYAGGQVMGALAAAPFSPAATATQGMSFAPRMLASAAEGSAIGAVQGFSDGEGGFDNRLSSAQSGAALGAAGGAIGHGVGELLSKGGGAIAGLFSKRPDVPSFGTINAIRDKAYKAADEAGVVYTPEAIARINNTVAEKLVSSGFHPSLQPGAAVVVNELEKLQGANVTLKGLDTIRTIAGNAYIAGNRSNNRMASKIIEAIDEAVESPSVADVLIGNGTGGGAALREARDYARRAFKITDVENAVARAELRAASTGSGANAENAVRQNLRKMLGNPRGFTKDEQTALRKAVEGTTTQNALRTAGKLAPTGAVSILPSLLATAFGGPYGFALPAAGFASKYTSEALGRKNVSDLLRTIAAGGSREAAFGPPNAVQSFIQNNTPAAAHGLGLVGATQFPEQNRDRSVADSLLRGINARR